MKKYVSPYIDILLFDAEEDIITTSTASKSGYTAAMDVNAQMDTVIGGKSGSISTVRLEDIKIK